MSGSGSGSGDSGGGGADDVLTGPAGALVAMFRAAGFRNAYLWEPREVRPPAVAVGVPVLRRRGPDEAESQLATLDYYIDYPCSLYYDLTDARPAQQKAVDGLMAVVAAVDADPSLGGTVFDAVVTDAEPLVVDEQRRPLVGYQFTVSTFSLVHPDSL